MPRFLPALLLVLAALVLGLAGPAQGAGGRPNVVVIMTDDQTLADLEAMPRTQSLIGDAGTTFDRSYVSYPLCCPSRATYLTGQYAHNHGVRSTTPPEGGFEALDTRHTLPVWLEAAGYDTSHVGKYLNGYGMRRRANVPPGWTDWHATVDKSTYQMWGYTLHENGVDTTYGDFLSEDPALYQTDVLRDKAIDVIDAHAPGRDEDPFFLSLNFVAPHGEVTEPGATTQPYVRPAPRHRGLFGTLQPESPAFDELDVRDKPPYVRGLARIGWAARERIAEDFRARRESLLAVDEAVEGVVGALERTGQLERTYVIFTSDNGFFQGEHRIPKGKYLAYDASSRVPLLVRGPGIAPGGVAQELVANIDLAPTILDATGTAADRPIDGRSLLSFAREPFRRTTRPILHEGLIAGDSDRDGFSSQRRTRVGTYYAIRTSRYLYVNWRGGGRELYDLSRDPFELESRHRDPRYADVRRALAAEVARLRRCEELECGTSVEQLQPLTRRAVRSRTR
ncbi:MAG: Choline-sulfatase [uncultured Solirubrobacteraceae bacterium]|uniref:Choline-sulfatase n=1 Tax=uncultured Solirubrobacteraceae bacterium TaxID=1162706 RepID=A0A6J4TV01_9ACTN|nr:MAG: Choline-sulfatase [uncultured Solirubrobacteraceae bacterium]